MTFPVVLSMKYVYKTFAAVFTKVPHSLRWCQEAERLRDGWVRWRGEGVEEVPRAAACEGQVPL